MKQLQKNDTITIIGRRWFEKTNGNTYHSVDVFINGKLLDFEKFAYGYDSAYEQSGRKILEKYYTLPIDDNQALWHLKEKGYNLVSSVSDVARKKDL